MNSTDHQDIYGISGSTGSTNLETGKYSITQGSASLEYFTDVSSILAFFVSQSMLLFHCTRADKRLCVCVGKIKKLSDNPQRTFTEKLTHYPRVICRKLRYVLV